MMVFEKLTPRNKIIALSILGAVVFFVVLGLYSFFKSKDEEKQDFRATKVEVSEVRTGSMTRTITAVGTLRAFQTVTIRPEMSGLISKVHVEGGEYVEKGTVLFTLDDKIAQAELKEAEAKLSHARISYDRATRLEVKNFGSTANKDKALAEFHVAEAALESANSRLSRTVIKAPFEGIVGLHNISTGTPVDQNKELITLVDITPMKVDFKLPAKFLQQMSVGQRVKVSVDGFQEKKFLGLVSGIDAKVDSGDHSIEARALISNEDKILKAGLFARVDVVVGAKENALIVPFVAVDKQGDQEFVYKIVEGRAFQTPVVTGIQEGENLEILRGVQAGDLVVTVGQLKVQDGSPVRYEIDGEMFTHDQEAEDKKIAAIKALKETQEKNTDSKEEEKEQKKEVSKGNALSETSEKPEDKTEKKENAENK